MMIARPRGIRRVVASPARGLRSLIQRTTGARMYAISPAKTKGMITFRPRMITKTMNSGKPQRRRNVRPEPSTPKNVAVRLRVGPVTGGGIVGSGARGTPPLAPPAGSLGGGSGGTIAPGISDVRSARDRRGGKAAVIRAARPDDYALFLALGTGEGPIATPAQWCESYLPFTHIYERDGRAIGFVDHKPRRGIGFVRNLYVVPDARGQGIGRILMAAAAAWLRAHDVAHWELVVDEDNATAIALYESMDFVEVDRITTVRLAWDALGALPSEPAPVQAVTAANVAILEQRFALDGRLQRALEPDAFAYHCEDGVALLVRSTVPVIRSARPALVGALLVALRPHA